MQEVSSRGGMRLLRNHSAHSVVSVGDGPPDPAEPWSPGGQVTELQLTNNSCEATIETSNNAWLWISLAPVRGWRWTLDGRPVELDQGPGIVQYLEVSPGTHGLDWRYRPPFLPVTVLISGFALQEVPPPFTSASYFTEYPEDIDLFGVSFNTSIGTWSLAGEVSYRPDAPLQIDDVEILFGALTPLNPLIPAPVNRYKSQLGDFAPGEEIRGYAELDSWQAQATTTRLFGPGNFLRAQQIAFVAEVGVNWVPDLPSKQELRFNGSGTDTGGGADVTSGDFNNPVTEPGGFADDLSWGYRLLARADYNNAIGAWTVSPRLAWAHDVDGTTPGPGGSFIDGRTQLTAGVAFNLLNEWVIDLSYTDYSGGGRYNLLRSRDFFGASVSYAF